MKLPLGKHPDKSKYIQASPESWKDGLSKVIQMFLHPIKNEEN